VGGPRAHASLSLWPEGSGLTQPEYRSYFLGFYPFLRDAPTIKSHPRLVVGLRNLWLDMEGNVNACLLRRPGDDQPTAIGELASLLLAHPQWPQGSFGATLESSPVLFGDMARLMAWKATLLQGLADQSSPNMAQIAINNAKEGEAPSVCSVLRSNGDDVRELDMRLRQFCSYSYQKVGCWPADEKTADREQWLAAVEDWLQLFGPPRSWDPQGPMPLENYPAPPELLSLLFSRFAQETLLPWEPAYGWVEEYLRSVQYPRAAEALEQWLQNPANGEVAAAAEPKLRGYLASLAEFWSAADATVATDATDATDGSDGGEGAAFGGNAFGDDGDDGDDGDAAAAPASPAIRSEEQFMAVLEEK